MKMTSLTRTAISISLLLTCLVPQTLRADDWGDLPPVPSYSDAPAQMKEDTEIRLLSSAIFTVPKGWFMSLRRDVYLLQDPQRQVTIARSERFEEDGYKAMEAAWFAYDPEIQLSWKERYEPKGRGGWEHFYIAGFEPQVKDERKFSAIARKWGNTWYVDLIMESEAAGDRRGSQVDIVLESLTPPGQRQEILTEEKPKTLDEEQLKKFDDFVQRALNTSKIPGAAVGLTQGGKIIYEKGFGVLEKGGQDPVTPKTLFLVGSVTKPFTTLMMARLVDKGLVSWDSPVTRLMPSFRLGDEATTKQLTLQYTVCACAGLPRQDMEMLFEPGDLSPESVLQRMGGMIPTTGYGETFQYSNSMVAAGGYIAAHAARPALPLGTAYDQAMQAEVFTPLGMKDTTFDFAKVAAREHALPHGLNFDADYTPLPLKDERWIIPVRPATGLWSNVEDLSRYLLMELSNGLGPDGSRYLSPQNLLKRRESQVAESQDDDYGLGLEISRESGITIINHGGNTTGFTAQVAFLPAQDVGMVVLTNGQNGNLITETLQRRLVEILLDGMPVAEKYLDRSRQALEKDFSDARSQIRFHPDPKWLAQWVGRYDNPDLGRVAIYMEKDKGIFDTGLWKNTIGQITDSQGDSELVLTDVPRVLFTLTPALKDGRATLTLKTAQQKYVFQATTSKK